MALTRWPRRIRPARRRRRGALPLLIAALVLSAAAVGLLALRSLVTDLAVSTARDAVVLGVNDIVRDMMADGTRSARLVSLEHDAAGRVTAVTTNVPAVNTLASDILAQTAARTAERELTVSVPVGELVGGTLFRQEGPAVPIRVTMLSSSSARFRSELTDAGINQTRHQIVLVLDVDVSLFMPWSTVSTSVRTEVPVSDTIIVGQVPEAYMNWGPGGRTEDMRGSE